MQDLSAVVNFALAENYSGLHLIGSSMGAAVTLLYYAEGIKCAEKILSMALIAPPFDLEELISGIRDASLSGPEGVTLIQGIPINNGFFEEIKKMNPAKRISAIDIPTLCIHGKLDNVVPHQNSTQINSISAHGSRLVIIPDGDHNLTAENHLAIIGDEISKWLEIFPG